MRLEIEQPSELQAAFDRLRAEMHSRFDRQRFEMRIGFAILVLLIFLNSPRVLDLLGRILGIVR